MAHMRAFCRFTPFPTVGRARRHWCRVCEAPPGCRAPLTPRKVSGGFASLHTFIGSLFFLRLQHEKSPAGADPRGRPLPCKRRYRRSSRNQFPPCRRLCSASRASGPSGWWGRPRVRRHGPPNPHRHFRPAAYVAHPVMAFFGTVNAHHHALPAAMTSPTSSPRVASRTNRRV